MAGPLYIAEPRDQLKQVELDGLTAVFHRRSGLTHLVAAPAPQILEVLAEAGDLDDIVTRLERRFELSADGDTRGAVQARLAELEIAGLVRRP